MQQNTDYGGLLSDTLRASIKTDNLLPLLVDGLIVVAVGSCTLGITFPALMRGYTAMCLRIARGETVAIGDSIKGFEHFVPSLMVGLLVLAAALVLSILPLVGTVAGLVLGTWVWCVHVDRPELGAIETFKASVALVRDHLVDTLVLWAVAGGIGIVLSATVIGSVAALAFGAMVTAFMYRRWSF